MVTENPGFSDSFISKKININESNLKRTVVICTVIMGLVFGGYLFYGSNYASGWHTTFFGKTFYVFAETGERAVGLHDINNSSYLFDEDGYIHIKQFLNEWKFQ